MGLEVGKGNFHFYPVPLAFFFSFSINLYGYCNLCKLSKIKTTKKEFISTPNLERKSGPGLFILRSVMISAIVFAGMNSSLSYPGQPHPEGRNGATDFNNNKGRRF